LFFFFGEENLFCGRGGRASQRDQDAKFSEILNYLTNFYNLSNNNIFASLKQKALQQNAKGLK